MTGKVGQAFALDGVDEAWGLDNVAIAITPPPNQQPTAHAGGPYAVDEGATVTLVGSGSDPEGGALNFAWDVDGNGTFEVAGAATTFSAAPPRRRCRCLLSDPTPAGEPRYDALGCRTIDEFPIWVAGHSK